MLNETICNKSSTPFNNIFSSLINLDFTPLAQFTAPDGMIWHAFGVEDGDSWWHEEPVCWEVFVGELSLSVFYIHGTLLPLGTFVHSEREWIAALERLLPVFDRDVRMEEVD